jgi:hypothetical protein
MRALNPIIDILIKRGYAGISQGMLMIATEARS